MIHEFKGLRNVRATNENGKKSPRTAGRKFETYHVHGQKQAQRCRGKISPQKHLAGKLTHRSVELEEPRLPANETAPGEMIFLCLWEATKCTRSERCTIKISKISMKQSSSLSPTRPPRAISRSRVINCARMHARVHSARVTHANLVARIAVKKKKKEKRFETICVDSTDNSLIKYRSYYESCLVPRRTRTSKTFCSLWMRTLWRNSDILWSFCQRIFLWMLFFFGFCDDFSFANFWRSPNYKMNPGTSYRTSTVYRELNSFLFNYSLAKFIFSLHFQESDCRPLNYDSQNASSAFEPREREVFLYNDHESPCSTNLILAFS